MPFVLTPFVVECRAGEGFPVDEIADRIVEATESSAVLASRAPVIEEATRGRLVKSAVLRSALIGLAGARLGVVAAAPDPRTGSHGVAAADGVRRIGASRRAARPRGRSGGARSYSRRRSELGGRRARSRRRQARRSGGRGAAVASGRVGQVVRSHAVRRGVPRRRRLSRATRSRSGSPRPRRIRLHSAARCCRSRADVVRAGAVKLSVIRCGSHRSRGSSAGRVAAAALARAATHVARLRRVNADPSADVDRTGAGPRGTAAAACCRRVRVSRSRALAADVRACADRARRRCGRRHVADREGVPGRETRLPEPVVGSVRTWT